VKDENAWTLVQKLSLRISKLSIMVHIFNPSYLEAKIRRIMIRGQSGQKVSETPISTNKPGMVAHNCYPSYVKA
jgi:hypothetical protein